MEYEKDCSLTDEVVPVDFTICMNEQAVISVSEYTRLKCKSREYNVGNGKNMCTFDLVHTSAGMVDIGIGTSEPFARWIADSFTVRAVVVDAKNRHYAEIEKDEKCVRIPFENLLPEKSVRHCLATALRYAGQTTHIKHCRYICNIFFVTLRYRMQVRHWDGNTRIRF